MEQTQDGCISVSSVPDSPYPTLGGSDGKDKWYVLDSNVTYSNYRLTILGKVNLILKDGFTLNATHGIRMAANRPEGARLTVYAQSTKEASMGVLQANASGEDSCAGIGGNNAESGGSVHVEKEAHNWDDGKVTVWSTALKEGIKTYTCETCGAEKTDAIPKVSPDTPIQFTDDMVTMDANQFTYNGRTQKPGIQVSYDGEIIPPEKYVVTYSDKNSVNAGTYTVTVKMREDKGFTIGECKKTYVIKKAVNTLRVKAGKPAVKYKKLKKKSRKLRVSKLLKIRNKGQGIKKYKLISAKKGKKNFKKFFKINAKKGKLTIKKKLRKGRYKLRLSVTAAGNRNYLKKTQKVTVKLRVK